MENLWTAVDKRAKPLGTHVDIPSLMRQMGPPPTPTPARTVIARQKRTRGRSPTRCDYCQGPLPRARDRFRDGPWVFCTFTCVQQAKRERLAVD